MSRSALNRRLVKLEKKILPGATNDPRWAHSLPLFVLFDGEELVGNPLPNLQAMVVICPGPRGTSDNRFNPMPERYHPYVVTK